MAVHGAIFEIPADPNGSPANTEDRTNSTTPSHRQTPSQSPKRHHHHKPRNQPAQQIAKPLVTRDPKDSPRPHRGPAPLRAYRILEMGAGCWCGPVDNFGGLWTFILSIPPDVAASTV